jgi:hypothetical protein
MHQTICCTVCYTGKSNMIVCALPTSPSAANTQLTVVVTSMTCCGQHLCADCLVQLDADALCPYCRELIKEFPWACSVQEVHRCLRDFFAANPALRLDSGVRFEPGQNGMGDVKEWMKTVFARAPWRGRSSRYILIE